MMMNLYQLSNHMIYQFCLMLQQKVYFFFLKVIMIIVFDFRDHVEDR